MVLTVCRPFGAGNYRDSFPTAYAVGCAVTSLRDFGVPIFTCVHWRAYCDLPGGLWRD